MARHRLPDNVHHLAGTFRKDRHGDPEEKPQWDEELPTMPESVAAVDAARKEWERVIADAPSGVITKTDAVVLAQFCLLTAKLWESPDDFTAASHTQLRLIQQELGFTPQSRGKIMGKPKSHDDDSFE